MKTTIQRFRVQTLSYLFITVLLSQSCVFYQKTPTTLNKASYLVTLEKEKYRKVKLINNSGIEHYFKEIIKEDSVYYGVLKIKGAEELKIRIDSVQVAEIYLQDTRKSIIGTWVLIALFTLPPTLIIINQILKDFEEWSENNFAII